MKHSVLEVDIPAPAVSDPGPMDKDTITEPCPSDDSGLGSPTSGEEDTRSEGSAAPTRSSARLRQARNYDLRESSVINRIQTERRRKEPKQPKPKQRAPPLSKYRRRSANARERSRMKSINDAFDILRRVVPELPPANQPPASKVPTKITTLRLAMNYISALREMLGYDAIVMPDILPPLATTSPNENEFLPLLADMAHLEVPHASGVAPPSATARTSGGQTSRMAQGSDLTPEPSPMVVESPIPELCTMAVTSPGSKHSPMTDICDMATISPPSSHPPFSELCAMTASSFVAGHSPMIDFCALPCTSPGPRVGHNFTFQSNPLDTDNSLDCYLNSPASSYCSHPGSGDSEADSFLC